MLVKDLISSNTNKHVMWIIDEVKFSFIDLMPGIDTIPEEILNRQVDTWMVNAWEGYIKITTK